MSTAARWLARLRSIRNAMQRLESVREPTLLLLPTTRSALMLARQVCLHRDAWVVAGPLPSQASWGLSSSLRSPAQLARELADQPGLGRTIVSFPDQLVGQDLSFAWIRFLGARYAFSIIEALLALRHRPRVLGLRTCSRAGDFELVPVRYLDLVCGPTSLQALMERLLAPLEQELREPPPDWLGGPWLALKSEERWRFDAREALKDLECLLRLHLLSPACDRPRTTAAVAAVIARQKAIRGPRALETAP